MYPWQQASWDSLNNSYVQQRFHHAQLLTGLSGVGKFELAQSMANALLCEQSHDLIPCGACKSCDLVNAATHPDKIVIAPDGNSISVDAIRTLSEFVYHSAQQGGSKVVIIDKAHKMTHAAANALLKTLEEPNAKRYLILTCDDDTQLPATILSRCSQTLISAQDHEQVKNWLAAHLPSTCHYTWLKQFYGQPLRLQAWLSANELDKIEQLYQHVNNLSGHHDVARLAVELSSDLELIDILGIFIQQRIQTALLNGVAFQNVTLAQQALQDFMRDYQQIAGLNHSLALSQLFIRLKDTLR